MERYEVILIQLNTKTQMATYVEVDEAELSENILISIIIQEQKITVSNDHYLLAYQEFRDKLLEIGYGIKCNGSRLNAVQSGMMGTTSKIYLVEFGKRALMKDVVPIWDYAEIDTFPDTKNKIIFLNIGLKAYKIEHRDFSKFFMAIKITIAFF